MGTTLSTLQPNSTSPTPTHFLQPYQLSSSQPPVKILHYRKKPTAVDILVERFHSSEITPRPKNQIQESIERCLTKAASITRSENLGPLSYQQILDYVNNTQEVQHPFGIQVEDIIFIEQSNEQNFEEFLTQHGAQGTRRMLLWHGTQVKRVLPILEDGFKKPKYNSSNKRFQGQGIYFADRASKSAQYCDPNTKPKSGQTGCLLLCDVLLGDVMYSMQPDNTRSMRPDNYHSVACPGKWIPSPDKNIVVENSTLGSLVVPIGRSIENPKLPVNKIKFNEYIVYATEQIKVVYLVFFKFTSRKFEN